MKIELFNQKKKQLERIHETIVARYNNDYLESEKLTPENEVSQSKLNAVETIALIEHLPDHAYFHTHQIIDYVQSEFQVIPLLKLAS